MTLKDMLLSAALAAGLSLGGAGAALAKNPFLANDYWKAVSVEQVKADMAAGHSLLEKDDIGRQALHFALRGNASPEVLRFVLDQKVPVRPDGPGVWAELYAVRFGNLETMKLIQSYGVDFTPVDYMGDGAVYFMAKGKALEVEKLDYLQSLGLPIDAQDRMGMTPVMRAAMNDKAEAFVDVLVERGAALDRINSQGRDLFMVALSNNDNVAMLERFYALSEDPKAEDNEGLSGVLIAASWGEISNERLDFLKDKGFDLTLTDARGQGAVHLIAGSTEEEAIESFEALAGHGLSLTDADNAGNTPLHLALRAKAEAEILWLIDHGAAVDAANAKGVTPLMLALARGPELAGAIDRMIAEGAKLNAADASGATTLIQAVKGGQPVARVAQILAAGADVNAVDGEGTTALMHAALTATDPAVVTTLLDAGADPARQDVFEDTALVLASENAALKDDPVLTRLK